MKHLLSLEALCSSIARRSLVAGFQAEKFLRFVDHVFRHDKKASFSSGVSTPEGLKTHFSATCSAAEVRKGLLLHSSLAREKAVRVSVSHRTVGHQREGPFLAQLAGHAPNQAKRRAHRS